MSSAATAAALQQSPIKFHTRATHRTSPTTSKLSFSGGLKLPKLTLKLAAKPRAGRRGGARMADSAASSYAAALADVASSNGTLEATVADVDKISTIFSDASVLSFFASPVVPVEKKREVIDEMTKSSSLQPHVANFLNILIDTRRIDMINEIVKEFEIAYNKMTETELAVVTSVVQLESSHLAQIAKGVQKLTGAKNVRIKTVIDESLVAGFTIRYGNQGSKMIDMSVKKQLEEIAEQLEVGDIQFAV